MPHTDPKAIKPRPDYPPKTPPPPKKPPSPPPPDPPRSEASELLAGLPVPQRNHGRRGTPVMRNRHGSAWTLESAPWVPKKAAAHVAERLTAWGFMAPKPLTDVVVLLTQTVVGDGGRRISVHLSEQDDIALILAISHQAPAAHDKPADVLPALQSLGAASCGTEAGTEGRQVWALLHLTA
ncbi:hypothetical protein [Streptomyces aureocirculatus]|uniref:hypothetical protein n=1 Tax=Streptomyces aureocirculatus TaxID=67275 RepID=UPI0004CBE750|nr:hypothetical protein [Streptomyces aureocirculatus]